MKILLTGASGRVGRFVLDELLPHSVQQEDGSAFMLGGHELTALDLFPPHSDRVNFIEADILDIPKINSACRDMDAIIHLAAIIDSAFASPDQLLLTNVIGTHRLLEAAVENHVPNFVFASSVCALGISQPGPPPRPLYFPIDELHPRLPVSPYDLSKAFGEDLCQAFNIRFGLQTICLRLCSVECPPRCYQDYEKRLPEQRKGSIHFWSFVDARDVAQACRLAVEACPPRALPSGRRASGLGHQVLFINGEKNNCDLPSLELVKQYYPDVKEIRHPQIYCSDPFASLIDISRARQILGYQPQFHWRKPAVQS